MSAELPVAIIGISCNLPGGCHTKDLYYEFLRNRGDGMEKPPSDRWDHDEWGGSPGEPGKYKSAMGGFINGFDQFDPLELGMSMKEAQNLEPSARQILEVAHQALVDSGIDYKGSHTGVYVAQLLMSDSEVGDVDHYENNSYRSLGRSNALRANRVSFIFDLLGPSLTLDTACSSSATAMHLAMSAIKLGEIDQALIIGGSAMPRPVQNVMISDLGVLSLTGSSKPFDADADGYARAEGFAATLVKRLDKAIVDNDHVYSIITGSSINANGRGFSMTTPEGDMQKEVIRRAYSIAKRQLSDSFFVELHGTGTPTGDPIEANASGKVFSVGRDSESLLRVGSVKGNIGHTEGCSFLASLIKVSLMLKHKEIIPNIRFKKPNPKINFSKYFMKVQTELEPITPKLAAPDGKWVASISSFGIGGSNAHVVVESFESIPLTVAPPKDITGASSSVSPQLYLFVIAAHTEATIPRWRTSLATLYQGTTDDRILRSLSYTLARQSRPCTVRSFAVAPAISPDINLSKIVITNPRVNPKLCLVFSGQGPQHIAMGRGLCASYPVFLATIKQNDETLVRKYGQESFLKRTGLFIPNEQAKLSEKNAWPVEDVVYSIVFIQLALVDLIKSLGIEYNSVVGHSIGEIAMGYASGHYDKVIAIGIAVARAAAMKEAEGNGSMVALAIGFQRAKYMIKQVLEGGGVADGLWIAAINSPNAVTVAGREELINTLAGMAKDREIFAARLNVTCAFHTPLMEPQEEMFKTSMKAVAVSGNLWMKRPVVRTMSTVDGQWLERDLDVDYCWDNIRQPVLFGAAIAKIVKENGPENVLFLEVAPHPVLRGYILQCKGQPVSLIRRPNAKVPAQNTGEHHQFLEGIGTLLTSGFKAIDFARLCAAPDGQSDFFKCKMPEYPYNKTTCSSESAQNRSIRLRQKSRPLCSSLFRMSLATHPDLAGHAILGVPLFPLSGYLDSVLENGAMVINDIMMIRPLVLTPVGTAPAYVGCVINGNQWEFRSAITNTFDNGNIQLDAVHARGSFLRYNPQFDSTCIPRIFDLKSKLASSRHQITGEEFYKAISSAYGYRELFSTCIKQIHEVPDENSWAQSGSLVELVIPTALRCGRDQGYIIHPSILDSIIHSALAMFVDMRSKSFNSNGTFVPSRVASISRWDGSGLLDLGSQLFGTFWTYVTIRTWSPEGPLKCDYIVTNSYGQVLLTIEGAEFVFADVERASHTEDNVEKCYTTVYQPKIFPLTNYNPPVPSAPSLDGPSYLCMVFEELLTNAHIAGRYVVRVLDLDTSETISTALDGSLVSSFSERLLVEYFCTGTLAKDADVKAQSMRYPHARPFLLDPLNPGELDVKTHSFDIVLQRIDLLDLTLDIGTVLEYLIPSGVLLLISDRKSGETTEAESTQELQNLAEFIKRLESVPYFKVAVMNLGVAGGAVILIHSSATHAEIKEDPVNELAIHHFTHGNESQLVDVIIGLSESSELWIVGDDDAIGTGALGIAACLVAEGPGFIVRSLLFEDHALGVQAREDIVRSLRRNHLLLEQHMKYTRTGNLFVRRLIYGAPYVKAGLEHGDMNGGGNDISTNIQPSIGSTEVQVSIGFISTPEDKSWVVFLGAVTRSGADVKDFPVTTKVLGISNHPITDIVVVDQSSVVPLPQDIVDREAVTLPIASLVPWLQLVENSKISQSSSICLLGADSCIGFIAVQLCQRFGAKFFCAVATPADAKRLSIELHVDQQSITTSLPGDDISSVVQTWLAMNNISSFDVVLNLQGTAMSVAKIHSMAYIHQNVTSCPTKNPSEAPITQLINFSALVERYPSKVTASLADILASHKSERFKLPWHSISFSKLHDSTCPSVLSTDSLAIIPNVRPYIYVTEWGQLFDPRKCYLLVGGSSELGVQIAVWMASRGARHFVLTSRRGPKALTRVDSQHLYYLRSTGISVKVIASDADKRKDMTSVILTASEIAPIGGIFLMTVVSRDGLVYQMSQKAFDDVYLSKVQTLNTLLFCVRPETLDFLLLFSTIGSVFGHGGQAAYCVSQLYLDTMAEKLPNTISISLPPITDSGMYKRLLLSSKGRYSTNLGSRIGITTAQACGFIADALVRRIPHYVPMIPIKEVPDVFSYCEPLLYRHLLPINLLNAEAIPSNQSGSGETPLTLLCDLLGLNPDQISKNIPLRDLGLDSLGAIRYSGELKTQFNMKISQFELLGSVTIAVLDKAQESGFASAEDDHSNAHDEIIIKDVVGLLPMETEHIAYGQSYTSDATPQ